MTVPPPLFGTLDTPASTAMIESQAGVSVAMFEFNWPSFEPSPGIFSASYRATMQSCLQAYQGRNARHPGARPAEPAAASYLAQIAADIPCRTSGIPCRTSGRSGLSPAGMAKCSSRPAARTGPSAIPP